MRNKQTASKSSINVVIAMQGEPLEGKLRRILLNGEPITDKAPIVYTERKDGVMPEYDIRSDKWEIAVDAKQKIAEAYLKKRAIGIEARDGMKKEGESSVGDN